jgi:hypothetical protein
MARWPLPHGAHPTGLEWTASDGALKTLKGVVYETPEAELRFRPSSPAGELPRSAADVGLAVATDQGLYLGHAVVLRLDPAARELCLDLTSELTQLQRRQYFRIRVSLGVLPGRALAGRGPADGAAERALRVTPRNLSGGGLCFDVDLALERDARVQTELPLEDGAVAVTCAVLECLALGNGAWRVRAYFVGLLDRDRQRIVRYVQRQQVLLHRHRRGA